MKIVFTRDKHGGDKHALRVERRDGTSAWMPSTPFFVEHDITHYAVETVFGYRDAFWGLIGQGWDFSNFEDRQPGSPKAVQLPHNAYMAELVVGSLQVDYSQGPFPYDEFLRLLQESAGSLGVEPPSITPDQFASIRGVRDNLVQRWSDLAPGGTLVLDFEV